jgi:hypothetical protein
MKIVAALLVAVALPAHAYNAVAKFAPDLPMTITVMDHAKSCNGGPIAISMIDTRQIEKTCDVKITKRGVDVVFPSRKSDPPMHWDKTEFTILPELK